MYYLCIRSYFHGLITCTTNHTLIICRLLLLKIIYATGSALLRFSHFYQTKVNIFLKTNSPFPRLTAKIDAESNCSSSWITKLFCKDCCNKLIGCCWWWFCWVISRVLLLFIILFVPGMPLTIELDPEPVLVVSEIELPDEKGGIDLSEGLGDDGAPAAALGESRGSGRKFWGIIPGPPTVFRGEEKVVMPLVRLRGLNLGASLKGTEKNDREN